MGLANNMGTHKTLLTCAVLVVASIGILIPASLVNPGELTKPVTISNSRAGSDGGSMALQALGANGKRISVERVGSMVVERSRQEMYVVNYILGVVPWRRTAEKGSTLEIETRELLDSWLKDNLPPAQRELLSRSDQNALRSIPGDTLSAYELLIWIGERR